MSQTVITTAFEALKAQQAAANTPVVLDEFVFANVPNLNITDPIDPAEAMPAAGQIVHRASVGKTGVVNANAVVYSVTLGADVGDFSFNWVGLRDKTSNTLAMIVHAPVQQKVKNNAGTQGNVLTRSFLMEYDGAKKETQITTPAGTWQIDFTARLAGMDERHRVENIDVYGTGAFIGDGFLVKRSGNNYSITAGTGYVGGLRAVLAAEQALTVATKPVKVWVDTSFTGTLTSVWQVSTTVTLADTLADYVKNDVNHYVFAVAQINADGSVTDLRKNIAFLKQENNLADVPDKGRARQALELKAAAQRDIGTAPGNVIEIGGLGFGLSSQAITAAFDWQQADFRNAEHHFVDQSSWKNAPVLPGITGSVYLEVAGVRDISGCMVRVISNAGMNLLSFLVSVTGAKGSRAFEVVESLTRNSDVIFGDTCRVAGFVAGDANYPYMRHQDSDTAIALATLSALNNGLALKPGTDGCEVVGFFGGDKGRPYVKQKSSGENIVLATAENVTNQLAAKAPLASPGLTGTPTAPTAAQTVNSTQIATTAFVKAALSALVNSSPAALDTLKELADALGNDANFATTITDALARKINADTCRTAGFVGGDALLPYFRHTVTDAIINLATKQALNEGLALKPGTDGCEVVGFFGGDKGRPYVKQKSSGENIVLATAENVTNQFAAKAPLASPGLTGTPTAPTAAQTVNSTQIATTAFVKAALSALVNSSPAALDTLKELADALGNDANFAATMTAALGRKIDGDSCGAAGFVGGAADSPYMRHTPSNTVISLPTESSVQSRLADKVPADTCSAAGFFAGDANRPYLRHKTSDTAVTLVPSSWLSNSLAPASGQQQFGAGKLIIQYGDFSMGGGGGAAATVTFQRAFPSACVAVIPVPGTGGATEQLGATFNTTQATITKGIGDTTAARSGRYMAIGY